MGLGRQRAATTAPAAAESPPYRRAGECFILAAATATSSPNVARANRTGDAPLALRVFAAPAPRGDGGAGGDTKGEGCATIGSGSDARRGDSRGSTPAPAAAAAAPCLARSVTSARSFASRARNARSSAVRRTAERCSKDTSGLFGLFFGLFSSLERNGVVFFAFSSRAGSGSGSGRASSTARRDASLPPASAVKKNAAESSAPPRAAARRRRAPRRESRHDAVASSALFGPAPAPAPAPAPSRARTSIIDVDAGFTFFFSSSPEYCGDEKGANNARRRVVVVVVVFVVVVVVEIVASRPGDPSASRLETGEAFFSFGTFGSIGFGFGLIAEPRATSSACSSA